jgi:hypothetical protein
MNVLKVSGYILLVLIVFYGLVFLATGGNLAIYRFWAPKQANAERVVFQNTNAYLQGKATYIDRLYLDEQSATGPQKEQLRRTILDEASTVDTSKLPDRTQAIISAMQGAQ